MQDFIVDRRYVLEDGLELRLAIRLSDRSLCVVGTKGDKLAVYDELDEDKLAVLGAPGLYATILKDGLEPEKFLANRNDKQYQKLVCQDPQDLGPVRRSEVREYTEVAGEEL